jgi:glycine cleavage system H protein
MIPHDILTLYIDKPLEYLLAMAFLISFVPFWFYVQGGPAAQRVVVKKRASLPRLVEWFHVPENVFYHQGHAWARVEPDGYVRVGMNDFARKLVGPLADVRLPEPGTRLEQGEPGWGLVADGRAVEMLSPIDGIVVERNTEAFRDDGAPDPYGRDWLLKIKPEKLLTNLKSLIVNGTERRWMELNAATLGQRLSPNLGLVLQDGGAPVDGLARAIDPDHWDRLVREYFLTDDGYGC